MPDAPTPRIRARRRRRRALRRRWRRALVRAWTANWAVAGDYKAILGL